MIPKHPHSISMDIKQVYTSDPTHKKHMRQDMVEWLDFHTPGWDHTIYGPLGLGLNVRFEFKDDTEVILFKLAWC